MALLIVNPAYLHGVSEHEIFPITSDRSRSPISTILAYMKSHIHVVCSGNEPECGVGVEVLVSVTDILSPGEAWLTRTGSIRDMRRFHVVLSSCLTLECTECCQHHSKQHYGSQWHGHPATVDNIDVSCE